MDGNRDNAAFLLAALKIVVVMALLYPLVHYAVLRREQEVDDGKAEANNGSVDQSQQEEVEVGPIERVVVVQPSCPLSQLRAVLEEICRELFLLHAQCTPEDVNNAEKHKIPKVAARNNTTGEPRGTIVGCVAAGLLLTSLGAAFLELYKAKSQTPVKQRPPMSRKCSLADLTVLKHNRKELVRRESIMEVPENGSSPKTTGFRPPPFFRRSSFPVGPSEYHQGLFHESRRTSIESRRLSIIESRRNSILECKSTSRQGSFEGRRISFEESPERRHWSRLVHRH